MKKRKIGIKQRVNTTCYFHGYLDQFCEQGAIGTEITSKRWKQIKDYGGNACPAEGMTSAKAPRKIPVSKVQFKETKSVLQGE